MCHELDVVNLCSGNGGLSWSEQQLIYTLIVDTSTFWSAFLYEISGVFAFFPGKVLFASVDQLSWKC